MNRRRVLKPIYNAAKRKDNLKDKTYFKKGQVGYRWKDPLCGSGNECDGC